MDRPQRGPAGPAQAGGAPVTANLAGDIADARNLVKSFGQTPALRGVSLTAARGEVVAVTGPSGSGKSTLLYLLGGLDIPDDGQVRVTGVDLATLRRRLRARFRRRNCGFIVQGMALLPQATAAENVEVPLLL